MWAPAIANILTRVITKEGWKGAGLKPNLAKGWSTWIAAWFLPAILTFVGGLIYFLIFRDQFDPDLGTLSQMMQAAEARTGQTIPLGLWVLALIQLGSALLIAPLVNSFFTFGEEFGWRGYLQPKLMPLGFRKAMLLMGLIWGVWHWPLIAMGHNHGLDYFGAPWTGMLAMVWFTFVVGTLFGWLVLRGGSVWPAVIGHSVINAFAGFPIYLLALDAERSEEHTSELQSP